MIDAGRFRPIYPVNHVAQNARSAVFRRVQIGSSGVCFLDSCWVAGCARGLGDGEARWPVLAVALPKLTFRAWRLLRSASSLAPRDTTTTGRFSSATTWLPTGAACTAVRSRLRWSAPHEESL